MTRAEAVNWLTNIMYDIGKSQHRELWHYEQALAEIKKMLEEQPQWVPCSERLPEYRKLVDITTRDLRVKLAYLDSIEEDSTDDLWIIPLEDAECALWNVVAWKPRPEPWKGDK